MQKANCAWVKSWINNGIKVIECKTCGFKHQYPYPDKVVADEFYEKDYYEKVKPKYLENVKNEFENRRMWADDKMKIFSKLLKNGRKPQKILDVGCSFGTFLQYFMENGWDCTGVEPSSYAAKFAREIADIEIHTELLENISLEQLNGPFDVVHIKETIDHLTDPLGFIQRCSEELLKPKGILCIETANQFSEMQMAVVRSTGCPMWWITADHIGYFDKKSLRNLVKRFGFIVKYEISTFPMELFPLMGENYVLNPELGPSCHKRRLHFEDSLKKKNGNDVRIHFYETLARGGFGRGIIQVAQLNKLK